MDVQVMGDILGAAGVSNHKQLVLWYTMGLLPPHTGSCNFLEKDFYTPSNKQLCDIRKWQSSITVVQAP
jgi:hypothetical protein